MKNVITTWFYGVYLLMLIACAGQAPAADEGLVAHWDFNDGAGDVLHDRSGNGNDGTIHGATWTPSGDGHALAFGGSNSYVDFPGNDRLAIVGDVTITAWVKLEATPFPNSQTNWYIINCEKYNESGFMLRINGESSFVTYRANKPGIPSEVFGKTMLDNNTYHHIVLVRRGELLTIVLDGRRDTQLALRVPDPTTVAFTISLPSQSFQGEIDDIRVYDRALETGEILGLYGQGAAAHGKDTSWIGKLVVTPFVYVDSGDAILEVDLKGIMPLGDTQVVTAELVGSDGEVVETRVLDAVPDSGIAQFAFVFDKLTQGEHELRVFVRSGERIDHQYRVSFDYPALPPTVASPADETVAALPPAPAAPRFRVEAARDGGFTVRMGNAAYAIESRYSYPNGGENALSVEHDANDKAEPNWSVDARKVGPSEYRVTASGQTYRIDRQITTQARRVLVQDTITNLTDDVIGLTFGNQIDLAGKQGVDIHGMHRFNPARYVHAADHGLGIIALDDVYMMQRRKLDDGDVCGLGSDGLGLDARASYTLRWAIYPDNTGDYYDFVNSVRADEGLDNRTVPGCLSIAHAGVWLRESPPQLLVERAGLTLASSGCVSHIPDDRDISIEGFEFIEYPMTRAMLRDTYAKMKRQFPDLKVMFHIAPSIYATTPQADRFSDSRLINSAGEHKMYSTSVGYFSQEKVDEGWAWYPYYPTLDNSFGEALLQSVDVMMDDIGVDGVFGDGLTIGYGGATTYDRWDGHSVELDPTTRTVKRKFGAMMLLSQDAYIAYVRKINAKGGVVVNNGGPATWTFNKENVIYTVETGWGNDWCAGLHFAPTVIGLAAPNEMGSQLKIHNDMLAKLEWGALYAYFFMSGQPLSYPAITTKMYPITVTQIRPGTIEAAERIVTSRSGVYGWPGERDLHVVYVADARGRMSDGRCLTTVDAAGARTRVDLRDNEIAVVVRTPIVIDAAGAINATVLQYDADGIDVELNGQGPVTLHIRDGAFGITPAVTYEVGEESVVAGNDGSVSIALALDGSTRSIRVAPAGE